jgi:hypothetical protein
LNEITSKKSSIQFQKEAGNPSALAILRRAIFYISLPFGILSFLLPLRGAQIGADAVQIGLFFTVFFYDAGAQSLAWAWTATGGARFSWVGFWGMP